MSQNNTNTTQSSAPADADGIPIWSGPGLSPCCWATSGQAHSLSCEVVTLEQFRAFQANRGR